MIQPEQQRRAYLEALGIDTWVPRDEPEPAQAGDLPEELAEEPQAPPVRDGLDWPALRDVVSGCSRCALQGRRD